MNKFYCKDCKKDKLDSIKQIITEEEIFDNDYKKKKFNKHVNFSHGQKRLSVFTDGSSDLYGVNILDAINSERSFFKEINGKLTLINPTTNILGTLFEDDVSIDKTDTVIVPNSTQPNKIHGFSDISSNYRDAKCFIGGKKLIND